MAQSVIEDAPHTIAILRALQLGDLLCSVPAMRALRAAFPQARVTLIGLPWAEAFVRRFSHYLDDFLPFPGWPGLPEQEPQIRKIPDLLTRVQMRRFDLALQMHGSGLVTNPLITLFGADLAAGYYLPGQYNPEGAFFPYPDGENEIRTWLRLVEALGIPPQGEQLEFPVTGDEERAFQKFREENQLVPGQYACLHPGARDEQRRWDPRKFARVGDALAAMGWQVVLTGTQSEGGLTGTIKEQMRYPALDAAGKTDLGTLALLLSNARLLVSNDTGVSHIAAAFQTPSVILFSTSEPERWRPINHQLHRAVLDSPQAAPQQVIDVIEDLLREAAAYA